MKNTSVSHEGSVSELMRAAATGKSDEVSRLLRDAASLHARDWAGRTALSYAVEGGHLEVAKRLIGAGLSVHGKDDKGNSDLLLAVVRGKNEMIRLLVQAGADVNARSQSGWGMLPYAIREKRYDVVKTLLASGANPDLGGPDGTSPLILATQNGNVAGIDSLLEAGADVGATNGCNWTALDTAVELGNVDCVVSLLRARGDPDRANSAGRTPLHVASFRGSHEIVRALLFHNANPNIESCDTLAWTAMDFAKQQRHGLVLAELRQAGGRHSERRNEPILQVPHYRRLFGSLVFGTTLKIASWTRMDGLSLGFLSFGKGEQCVLRDRLHAALDLIAQINPRLLLRLRRDIDRMLFMRNYQHLATYVSSFGVCILNAHFVTEETTTAAQLACILSHEATHARLRKVRIMTEFDRIRVERMSCQAELDLARRIPGAEDLVKEKEVGVKQDPIGLTAGAYLKRSRAFADRERVPRWLQRILTDAK